MINHIETEKRITSFVEKLTGITEVEIKSAVRNKHYVRARAIYTHVMRLHEFSYPEIGFLLNRDHTSVMHLENEVWPRHSVEVGVKIENEFSDLAIPHDVKRLSTEN